MTKDVRLISTHFFIMEIPNRKELQQILINHSSDVDFKDFMKICAAEKYSLLFILNILYSLVNHTILPSENPLRFRKNLLT